MDIKKMSNKDIKYGIDRCNARLAGIMPMGYMDKERCLQALEQISEYSDYMTKSVEISKDDIRRLIKFLEEELENADN